MHVYALNAKIHSFLTSVLKDLKKRLGKYRIIDFLFLEMDISDLNSWENRQTDLQREKQKPKQKTVFPLIIISITISNILIIKVTTLKPVRFLETHSGLERRTSMSATVLLSGQCDCRVISADLHQKLGHWILRTF